jgi:hypothetical protein
MDAKTSKLRAEIAERAVELPPFDLEVGKRK